MDEKENSISQNKTEQEHPPIINSHKRLNEETFSFKIKKFFKKLFKYSLIIIISIIALYFLIYFIKSNSLKPLEKTRTWTDSIPYFKVTLKTSLRYSDVEDVWADDGNLFYKLYLEGDTTKYIYDNYDENARMIIQFLDKEGFKIDEYILYFKQFTRVVNENGKVYGFSEANNYYTNSNFYKAFTKIKVAWSVKFDKKH